MTNERARPTHLAARALTATALLVLLTACAGTSAGNLAERAEREAVRATSTSSTGSFASITPPPGLSSERIAITSDPRASALLEDILADLTSPPALEAADPQPQALRNYIRGRAALLDSDPARAIELLTRAVEKDPNAAAAWRDLGEAHRLTGDRFAADAAHRRAVEINPYERRSLLRLGLDAATRRDFRRAIELLSRIDIHARPGDPAERHLVWTTLGQALLETGSVAAGAELMSRGMDLPEVFSRPTFLRSELELLYRNRADSWTAIGDAHARLDLPRAALLDYERAATFPTFDPVSLVARRMYALLADDRPASAATALLDAISRDGLTLEDQHLELIAYLRQTTPAASRLGEELESNIRELASALPEQTRRRLASRVALARAAALADDPAAKILRERLALAPDDSAAITQLLARTNANDPAALALQVAALIEASPLHERVYTRTAIALAGDASTLLEALAEADSRRGASLLRARLLLTLAQLDEAEEVLTDVIAVDRTFAPAVSALTELLLSQRRYDEAAAVIEELNPDAGEPALLAKARGLASLGRSGEALALLTAAADATDATATIAYQLGSLNERLGLSEPAAQRYAQAVALDPLLEQAHAARIRLYNQRGALANRDLLFAAVRDLRNAIPSARTLRWLRAQELATSGQYGAALRALQDLADEHADPLVERALVSVWIATSSADDAEQWLRERLTKRPGDATLITQLARALSAQGKHQDAADLLQAELDRRPGDAAVSLQLETLLRQNLNSPAEADALTLRRLENAPPSVATGLQEASVWLRQGRYADAAAALTASFENAPTVLPNELRNSLSVAQSIASQSQTDPELRPLAVDLIEAIVARDLELPEPAHRLRILLLTLSGATNDHLLSALARAYQDTGEAASTTAGTAVQSLIQQGRPADALTIIETFVSAQPNVDTSLAALWLSIVAQFPDPGSAERLIDLLSDRSAAALVYGNVLDRPDAGVISESDAAAELAHAIAQSYGGGANNQNAAKLYRVALRYNPAHVMANNNLGYQLLIEGSDLNEAERLIQSAYDGDPNSAAVIDSLGWVRYLRGVFQDETDAMGIMLREGAVPLLERAVRIGTRDGDSGLFELHHHLGDAYWRTGKQDAAIIEWKAGQLAARALIASLGANAPSDISQALENLESRLDAAAAGEHPPLTPLAGETPAPTDAR